MKNRKQIFYIHGGTTFKSRKDFRDSLLNWEARVESVPNWNGEYFDKKLSKDFDIIRPRMPLSHDARYEEWKIYFEKFFPYLRNNIILVGCSLGGIFLAKYLSENKFPKKILATYLIAPPFDNTLPGEDLVGGFRLGADLSLLEKNSSKLYLFFSANDEIVPLSQMEKYKKKLKQASFIVYPDKGGHFRVPEFPELIKMIKSA